MTHDINWSKVPVAHMTGGIKRYVERGIAPGHFLTAVLSNDLFGAVRRADDENAMDLALWVRFIYMELPSGCHGSLERVEDWIKAGGLKGMDLELQQQAEDES